MPESGTKLSGIAAWAEAFRASDSADVAALGERLASATDPDEIRQLALQWASSDRRTERALGRSLLHGLADDAGGEIEANFRQMVPWHVALNTGVVPTAESGDFVICVAAGPLSNVAFSLLMAHVRRPVQIVDVSESQYWSAFAQLYISVVPAPLREQLLSYRPGAESETAILFPAAPDVEAKSSAHEAPTGVAKVAEAKEEVTDFVTVADEPTQPLWDRFSKEEMRSLRACPVGEGPDGVEFLVAIPANSATQDRLSEMAGGKAVLTLVSLVEVNAAWREQFGEDMAPLPEAAPESESQAQTEPIPGEEPDTAASDEPLAVDEPGEGVTAASGPAAEERPNVAFPPDPELERLVEEVALEASNDPSDLASSATERVPVEVEDTVVEETVPAAISAPDPAAVALVPSGLAWFARACPYRLDGETLVCWVTEPYDETLLAAIERRSGRSLLVEPMPADDVMKALITAYGQELAGVIEPKVAGAPQEPEPEPPGGVAMAEPALVEEAVQGEEAQVEPVAEQTVTEPEAASDALTERPEVSHPPIEVSQEPSAEPQIAFSEPPGEERPQSALDQLLKELELEPPAMSTDQDWRPAAGEPEFLTTDFAVPPKNEETTQTPTTGELANEDAAPQAPAEAPGSDSGPTPVNTPETLTAQGAVPVDPVKASVTKTDEGFTTEATEEARAAWEEYMKRAGQANRAEAHVDAVMSRLNREIALDAVAANAVESDDESGEDEDSPVAQEATAWTQEEVEEARIGQRHADSVQRLMGHSTMPSAEILARLGRHLALAHRIVPVTIENGTLHVIAAIPLAPATVREISHEVGMPLQVHLGSSEAVDRLLAKAYPEVDSEENAQLQVLVDESRKREEVAQQSWLEKLMNRVSKSG